MLATYYLKGKAIRKQDFPVAVSSEEDALKIARDFAVGLAHSVMPEALDFAECEFCGRRHNPKILPVSAFEIRIALPPKPESARVMNLRRILRNYGMPERNIGDAIQELLQTDGGAR